MRSRLRPVGAHGELVDAVHRDRRRGPSRMRGVCGVIATARKGESWPAAVVQLALVARALDGEIAVEPPVARALVVGRAALHVVLRVEVRARVARAADRVHRRENAVVPERLERRERRVQPEEAVEIDRRWRRRTSAAEWRSSGAARSTRARRAARRRSTRRRRRAGRARPALCRARCRSGRRP